MLLLETMKQYVIKKIILLSIVGFLLVIAAGAFHDNDKTFLLRPRTVYKIKTFAGTMGNSKIGSAPVDPIVFIDLVSFCLLLTAFIHGSTTVFIPSQIDYRCLNKAPPARA
jgi:hypothetical protein